VEEGRLRRDLFFRVNAVALEVPPLRERPEDLPELVEHFRGLAAGPAAPVFDDGAMRALAEHAWPGNIRELQNVVTRLVLTRSERVRASDAREVLGEGPAEGLFSPALLRDRPLDELLARLEKEYLLQLRALCGGEVKAMARTLGVTVFALYKRFRRLGIAARG
jgi:two-component system response regulator HydG